MRRFFGRIFGFLALAPVSGFIAAAILIGTLWLLGDLLPISAFWRWVIIGVIVFLYVLLVVFWWWRRRKRNKAMLAEMAEPEPDPTGEAIDAQQAELQSKFAEAMTDLSKLKFKSKAHGTRYVYELPWYIFIGPPGAGKTEALKNCGLEFPLRRGEESISIDGGAGTRDCDWVFTNEAVFIDTAGRYTTQGSNKEVDSAAWGKFLELLSKYRPREPINGVIVAISVKDIATSTAEELDDYAASVRERLSELCEKMNARIPVYVMFTKADLLIGFTEFFQSMRPSEREQVWGLTFPLGELAQAEPTLKANLGKVDEELDALLGQLGEMQFARLQDEPDLQARARVFGFPAQFATLKPVITRFMNQAFAPDRYSTPMLLRGFYFTSATQIGQPVDRLIATLSREFGVEQRAVATLGGSGRSYFLSDLLKKVIFPEQGIVSKTGKRKSPIGRYAAIAASVLLPILFGAGLFLVYQHNQVQAAALTETLEGYKADIAALPVNPVDDHDFRSIVPALNRLRDETERLKSDDASAPLLGLGVDDTGVLADRAENAYQTALHDLLLPRIMYRYERKIEENLHKSGDLYNILKTYLMVAGAGPLDIEFVKSQVQTDWLSIYSPSVDAETLVALDGHLDALLAKEFIEPQSLNDEAVALARDSISQISIAERAYRALTSSPEAQALEPWTATSAGGSNTKKVFTRRSGVPLDKPIPGVFTKDGFWTFFMPQHALAARASLEETWLVADEAGKKPSLETITREIVDLYNDEYIGQWTGMLNDLRVVPFRDAKHAGEVLVSLTSGSSPLRRIIESTAEETRVGAIPGEDSPLGKRLRTDIGASLRGKGILGRYLDVATRENAGTPAMPVQENFQQINDFVEDNGGLGQTMSALKRLYGRVGQGEADIKLLSTTPEAKAVKQEVDYAPEEVKQIVIAMLEQANTASSVGVRARLSEVWSTAIYPQCRDRLHGRYPFGNGDEIPLGDLSEIMAPDGLIDSFFKTQLTEYVDASVSPWRWRPGIGAALGMPVEHLAFFEQAARIRDSFFPAGSTEPRLKLSVYPVKFNPDVSVVRFSLSGATGTFKKGEEVPASLNWPGAQAANGASVIVTVDGFVDQTTGQPETEDYDVGVSGDWGLFKLAQKVGFRSRGSGDKGRIHVAPGGHAATLEFRMTSSNNPFALREEMISFRCPASL